MTRYFASLRIARAHSTTIQPSPKMETRPLLSMHRAVTHGSACVLQTDLIKHHDTACRSLGFRCGLRTPDFRFIAAISAQGHFVSGRSRQDASRRLVAAFGRSTRSVCSARCRRSSSKQADGYNKTRCERPGMNTAADFALLAVGVLLLLFVFVALIGGAMASHRVSKAARLESNTQDGNRLE